MDKLLTYLNSLEPPEQAAFAARCGTTVGYMRKAISIGQRFSEGLCLRIGVESAGAVLPRDLRADVDWPYLMTCPVERTDAAGDVASVGT